VSPEADWSDLAAEAEVIEPDSADEYGWADLLELQLALPPALKVTKQIAQRFFSSLSYCSYPLSFEILGLEGSIIIQLVCHQQDLSQVRAQLEAYFPEAVLTEERKFLKRSWDEAGDRESVIVDFGLSCEFMRPLLCVESFEVDPLIAVIGALTDLEQGELGLLQVLFQRVRSPWAESVMRSVTDLDGKAFFADAPETVTLAKHKINSPLFAAVMRVATTSGEQGRGWQIARKLGGALAQFASPGSNELIPLSNDGYNRQDHLACPTGSSKPSQRDAD
jgi:hypothetical protein